MGSRGLSTPWPAPAKLNLGLRIVGRRSDGYHRLQTVFQFIERCDFLGFVPRTDGRICRQGTIPGVTEDEDLTVRAARLLRERHGPTPGVTIYLDKHLPMGGGLGGGSSDAATTLVALNHYWELNLSTRELAELGLSLGADVPVFVLGHAAWGENLGDTLTPLVLQESWFLILIPDAVVSTREVFQDSRLTRDSLPVTMRRFLRSHCSNDCEAVVFKRFPAVVAAARWLSRYASPHLTGTGCCVFAAFARQQDALAVASWAPCKAMVAMGKNQSSLQERLRQEKISSATGP